MAPLFAGPTVQSSGSTGSGARPHPSGASSSALLAALLGALGAHLVGLGTPMARAAWCWDTSPPRCRAPVVENGYCEEGDLIPAGGQCTASCREGKVVSGSCNVKCPPSAGDGNCLGDLNSGSEWWMLCYDASDSQSCANNLQLGTAETAAYGSFECKDRGEAEAECKVIQRMQIEDKSAAWDNGVLGLLGALVVLLFVAAVIGRLPVKGALLVLFEPHYDGWNLGNAVAVVLVLVGLFALLSSLPSGSSLQFQFVSGYVAGIAVLLPMVWAFLKAGAHDVAKMSREAAWRIHNTFGFFALVFGGIHGVIALGEQGFDGVLANGYWFLGLLGLAFMVIAFLPMPALMLMPRLVTYDRFKLMHLLAPVGYVLVVVHMLDHAVVFGTARSVTITVANVAVLAGYIVQRSLSLVSSRKAEVLTAEVVSDSEATHISLRLRAPGFTFMPGQFAYVHLPSASAVPHPFTLVADPDGVPKEGILRFIVKAEGAFTQKLATVASSLNTVRVQGPYGLPVLPDDAVDAVAFVIGGVGITPALSLFPLATRLYTQGRARLFWSLRSHGLLRTCAPFLEEYVKPGSRSVVRIKKGAGPRAEARHGGALLLGTQEGQGDLGAFMSTAAVDFAQAGAKTALLFVCGPPGLAAAASHAASASVSESGGLHWRVHIEQFHFLHTPQFGQGGGSKADRAGDPRAVVVGALAPSGRGE